MYYVSREDARSDLLLSAAVFVFGPIALSLLLGTVGLRPAGAAPGMASTGMQLLRIVLVVAVTVLVPLLLMKYRQERPAALLGLGAGDRSVATGALAAVPLLVAAAVLIVLGGGNPINEHPLLALRAGDVLGVVARLLSWVGVLGLALYLTVKARDAFGGEPVRVADAAVRIGRILAIAAAVLTGVVILTAVAVAGVRDVTVLAGFVVWPLAVGAAVWLILRRTDGASTTTLPTLVTPTIIAAVGNFHLALFDPMALVQSLYWVALSGGLGLGVGILAERTRRGGGVVVFAVLVALGTGLSAPIRLL